jgi:hypothetical protein
MATMLAYVLTDLDMPKDVLEKSLKKTVKNSFNSISVDGDQSTSDTVFIMSSQIVRYIYIYIYVYIYIYIYITYILYIYIFIYVYLYV